MFVGSLSGEGATKGVFVTTSDFSREAKDYIQKVQHRIVLIDGQQFASLMLKHGVGVRVRASVPSRETNVPSAPASRHGRVLKKKYQENANILNASSPLQKNATNLIKSIGSLDRTNSVKE